LRRPDPARWLPRLAPLAVSAACLWALATRLDWPAATAAFAAAHWPLVALAATLALGSLGLRAWRWRLLLGAAAPPAGPLVTTYCMGAALGLLVPASGEVTRAWLLGRGTTLRTSYVLGCAAVEKLLDVAAVLALLAVGLGQAARLDGLGGRATGVVVALLIGAAGLLLLLARARHGGLRPPAWLPPGLARAWTRLSFALLQAGLRFAAGAAAVARLPRAQQAAILSLTLLIWANACLVTVLSLVAFGLGADWAIAAVLYGALLLGLSVPAAPGALGTFELVAVAVLQAFGLPLAASAAFAVGFHVLTFTPPLVAGALAWWWSTAHLAGTNAAPLAAPLPAAAHSVPDHGPHDP
jgi:uncharacterized protein (TIRG00374 family)